MSYPLPEDEDERLQALHRLELLDSPAEVRFDRIVDLASRLFDVPQVAVSLIDEDRQWFMASCGVSGRKTPREESFCTDAIMEEGVMVVCDAQLDPRFADNPHVEKEDGLRFYAGNPLSRPANDPRARGSGRGLRIQDAAPSVDVGGRIASPAPRRRAFASSRFPVRESARSHAVGRFSRSGLDL